MKNPYRRSVSKATYYKKTKKQSIKTDCNCSSNCKKMTSDYFNLGDMAPKFTLPGIVNKKPTVLSLSDYKGKWVLLFFYGSDFTFV